MTTDKPKWWQSWMVYTLIGLLLTLGPYLGGYMLLGRYDSFQFENVTTHARVFKYDILGIAFGPLGWAEAKLRGEEVIIMIIPDDLCISGRENIDIYEPG
jgi:hypothetical protein